MREVNSSRQNDGGNSSGKKISDNRYTRHMLRAKAAGNYFTFFRNYVTSGVMTRDEALMVQDLINLASMKTGDEGWFNCTVAYLEKSLAWSADTQKRVLKSLDEKGFIEQQRRGIPPSRYVRVDIDAIETALDAAEDEKQPESAIAGQTPRYEEGDEDDENEPEAPKAGGIPRFEEGGIPPVISNTLTSVTQLNTKNCRVSVDSPASPARRRQLDDLRWAKELHDALVKKGKLMRKPKLSSWAAELRSLRSLVGEARFEACLDWYCDNVGKKFVPEAFSAASVKTKFSSIESAMVRAKEKEKPLVSPKAQAIAERLKPSLYWPKGSLVSLEGSVQRGLDNLAKWRASFSSLGSHQRMLMRLSEHLEAVLGSDTFVIDSFMVFLNDQLQGWDEWNGDLLAQAWTPRHRYFRPVGRKHAGDFCGDPSLYDKLLDVTWPE
jgi:hypothetical protein